MYAAKEMGAMRFFSGCVLAAFIAVVGLASSVSAQQNVADASVKWAVISRSGELGKHWNELNPDCGVRLQAYLNSIKRCLPSMYLESVPQVEMKCEVSDFQGWWKEPKLAVSSAYVGSTQDFQPAALPFLLLRIRLDDAVYQRLNVKHNIWYFDFPIEVSKSRSSPEFFGGSFGVRQVPLPAFDKVTLEWRDDLISQIQARNKRKLEFTISIEYANDEYGKYISKIIFEDAPYINNFTGDLQLSKIEYCYTTKNGIWLPESINQSRWIQWEEWSLARRTYKFNQYKFIQIVPS
ncbi:MAG: hypothetical protein HRF49_09270 [bacterium]